MTAPTPERRVGEAGKVYVTVDGLRELHGHAMSVGTVDQWCKVALDFAEQSSAEVASLTAEVERLRGVVEAVATSTGELLFYHEQHLVSEAADRFRLRVLGPLRAALSLPTPSPEATEEERNFAARQPFLGCRKDAIAPEGVTDAS